MTSKYEALCISSGGIKGFCALGALQYMQDNKLLDTASIKHMSGTSIGAIITFFLAIGFSPIELMVYMCTHNVFESLKWRKLDQIFDGNGFYDFSGVTTEFEKMCLSKMHFLPTMLQLFENTGIELTFCTYNLTEQKVEYITHTSHPDLMCLQAVRMSANLPFLFSSIVIDKQEYIDGACADAFPIKALPFTDKKTIGIYLDSVKQVPTNDESSNESKKHAIIMLAEKTLKILTVSMNELHQHMVNEVKHLHKNIDVLHLTVTEIPVYKFDLRKDERLDLFSMGYTSAKKFFEKSDI